MKKTLAALAALGSSLLVAPFSGCGGDGNGSGGQGGGGGRPDQTGAACKTVADCYPDVAPGDLHGDALCLTDVRGGYCTHTCGSDDDCCAAKGECKSMFHEVCSPFESKDDTYCFLSCEPGDLFPPPGENGPVDEQEFCQREAGRDFICRSSGGGSDNRKICVPGDCGVGAGCANDADCASGLTCATALPGGYCGPNDCTLDADCPTGSLCVKHTDGNNHCFRSCAGESDCTFCRGTADPVRCTNGVTFAEQGTTGSVCVP